MNIQGPLATNMDYECNTPEIAENISNIMMLENNEFNGSYPQTPNISQYQFPDQQEASKYAPSPAVPDLRQESSLPAFCGPMVDQEIPHCFLFPSMNHPSQMLKSIKGFYVLVMEELKWTIRAGKTPPPDLQYLLTKIASLTTEEEVGSWVGECTANNSNMHQSLNNNNTGNSYNYGYSSYLQSHGSLDGYCYFTPGSTLKSEDEDRRKRRRQMKIAAIKCRNKEKKTANLQMGNQCT